MVYLIVRISEEEYSRFNDQKQSQIQATINEQLTREIVYLTQRLTESQTVAKRVYQKRLSENMRFPNEQAHKLVQKAPQSQQLDLQSIFFWENMGNTPESTEAGTIKTVPQKWWSLLWEKS